MEMILLQESCPKFNRAQNRSVKIMFYDDRYQSEEEERFNFNSSLNEKKSKELKALDKKNFRKKLFSLDRFLAEHAEV